MLSFPLSNLVQMQKSAGNGEIRRFLQTMVKMMTLTSQICSRCRKALEMVR